MNKRFQTTTLPHGATAPPAVVLNLFYTGLGIARSLGERGVPVVGLTARHRIYGNFTRYAKVRFCPDSREEPEALLPFLIRLGQELGRGAVIFPTRDDDLVFLDRFRDELSPYFKIVSPDRLALNLALDKWETYKVAGRAGLPAPRCWIIDGPEDLRRVLGEVTYPCVLKPASSSDWRQGANWQIVGARKAIPVYSSRELLAEYDSIARAERRAIIQEMVRGGDDCLVIAACYIDRQSRWVAGFNARKLAQVPEGFGTGCLVQSVSLPELAAPTQRLLESMGLHGIAEVEYKWDAEAGQYKLIEVNPRPWDQHRLGNALGVDLIYLAYCDHADLAMPAVEESRPGHKWIAEDTFFTSALALLWRRDSRLRSLLRQARGKRLYAIWSLSDPLPLIAFGVASFFPQFLAAVVQAAWSAIKRKLSGRTSLPGRGSVYESCVDKRKTVS